MGREMSINEPARTTGYPVKFMRIPFPSKDATPFGPDFNAMVITNFMGQWRHGRLAGLWQQEVKTKVSAVGNSER